MKRFVLLALLATLLLPLAAEGQSSPLPHWQKLLTQEGYTVKRLNDTLLFGDLCRTVRMVPEKEGSTDYCVKIVVAYFPFSDVVRVNYFMSESYFSLLLKAMELQVDISAGELLAYMKSRKGPLMDVVNEKNSFSFDGGSHELRTILAVNEVCGDGMAIPYVMREARMITLTSRYFHVPTTAHDRVMLHARYMFNLLTDGMPKRLAEEYLWFLLRQTKVAGIVLSLEHKWLGWVCGFMSNPNSSSNQ